MLHAKTRAYRPDLRGPNWQGLPQIETSTALVPSAGLLHGTPPRLRDSWRRLAHSLLPASLDYELELGFVISHGLFNASPEDGESAIGGFVVLNDFSARDVQLEEMNSGFGPQKVKHFTSAISNVLVTDDEVLPSWRSLKGYVKINGHLVAETTSESPRWSLGEVLTHASRSERLYPGEFFGTGTFHPAAVVSRQVACFRRMTRSRSGSMGLARSLTRSSQR